MALFLFPRMQLLLRTECRAIIAEIRSRPHAVEVISLAHLGLDDNEIKWSPPLYKNPRGDFEVCHLSLSLAPLSAVVVA